MELAKKKHLFRQGKPAPLTIGFGILLIFFSVYFYEHFVSYPTLVLTYENVGDSKIKKEEHLIFKKDLSSSILWDWIVD